MTKSEAGHLALVNLVDRKPGGRPMEASRTSNLSREGPANSEDLERIFRPLCGVNYGRLWLIARVRVGGDV